MDKSKILQILGPGLAAAAVLLVVGLLITRSDWAGPPNVGTNQSKPPEIPTEGVNLPKDEFNGEGMSDSMPAADAPEWKADSGIEVWDVKEGSGDKACPPVQASSSTTPAGHSTAVSSTAA